MSKNPFSEYNLLKEFYNQELKSRIRREFYQLSDDFKNEMSNTLSFKIFRFQKAWSNLLKAIFNSFK